MYFNQNEYYRVIKSKQFHQVSPVLRFMLLLYIFTILRSVDNIRLSVEMCFFSAKMFKFTKYFTFSKSTLMTIHEGSRLFIFSNLKPRIVTFFLILCLTLSR